MMQARPVEGDSFPVTPLWCGTDWSHVWLSVSLDTFTRTDTFRNRHTPFLMYHFKEQTKPLAMPYYSVRHTKYPIVKPCRPEMYTGGFSSIFHTLTTVKTCQPETYLRQVSFFCCCLKHVVLFLVYMSPMGTAVFTHKWGNVVIFM